MNVTLGVPRLKEIINASKVISTPIIEARLVQNDSMTSARIVKAQIEKTTLGEISHYIKEVHRSDMSYISIKLDMNAIQNLHLNVNAHSVRFAILSAHGTIKSPALRALGEKHVMVLGPDLTRLRIFPAEPKESKMGVPAHQKLYFNIQALKNALPQVIVKGIPTVSRAVINEEADSNSGKKIYYLLLEGYGK